MENNTYRIVLQDGRIIDNLRLNGNNFISAAEITDAIFSGNLSTVTIEGPDGAQTFHDMKLIQISQVGDEFWFILSEKSEQEKMYEKMEATTDDIILVMAELIGGN